MLGTRESLRRACLLAWGATLLWVCWAFFLFPAAATLRAMVSPELRASAQPPGLIDDFDATAARYRSWAIRYLESQHAAALDPQDVAGTEWPIFGSVFLLLTAEALSQSHALPITGTTRETLRLAAEVVADPATATWVQGKWGRSYLERENVFYRMLLILGLGTYESLTHDTRHAAILRTQSESLARELLAAPLHLADDYPGECYPSDVLWAVAALQRAAARSVGRFDYAVPLVMQAVPASWPTPFGALVPGAMSWIAADGWCFGELALSFSLTRPNLHPGVVRYQGGVPPAVWMLLAFFAAGAARTGYKGMAALRRAWLDA